MEFLLKISPFDDRLFKLILNLLSFLSFIELITELKAHIPDVENIFNVHRRIGEGTFSTVFLATLKCHENVSPTKRKLFAVKYLIPTSHPNRIERELKCLLEIG